MRKGRPFVSRDWRLYAQDIAERCRRVELYVAGLDFAAFVADDKTVDAVLRNLEIIGEAAKRLPKEVTAEYPEIPWSEVCGFRDVLAHQYFKVSASIIWNAVEKELTGLKAAADGILVRHGMPGVHSHLFERGA